MSDKTKWLTFVSGVAGVITIGNLGYNFLVEIKAFTGLNVMDITPPFRFIAFIILESFLAYGLGWLLAYLSEKGEGLPETWIWVTTLVSSWASLFNVQWMLIGPTPDKLTGDYFFFGFNAYVFQFLFFTVCATGIAVQFISYHCKNSGKESKINDLTNYQLGSFVVMYFAFLIWL